LSWLSENGLSVLVYGRECVFVTPRSASKNATAFERIDDPRGRGSTASSALVALGQEREEHFHLLPALLHVADADTTQAGVVARVLRAIESE
jgi:hypothetical protein